MVRIRPFRGIRPEETLTEAIAALPYDVYSSEEARQVVEKNPMSFLKIDRAETQFPRGTNLYAQKVYDRARDTLREMRAKGEFVQDDKPCYYIYALTMEERTQAGLVCCVSIDDYLDNVVRKHENTREEKEIDRTCHVDTCGAQTGPIFLTYRSRKDKKEHMREAMQGQPLYDFVSDDGIGHRVWKIEDAHKVAEFTEAFQETEHLYIADGHHRAASAVKAGLKRRAEQPGYTGEEEFNYFLSVVFPSEELHIFDYNRIVHRIPVEVQDTLLEKLETSFGIEEVGNQMIRPEKKGEIGMYLQGRGFCLTAKSEVCSEDPIDGLDVSILQNRVLGPVFGIEDPKTDERMKFVGGIRGLEILKRTVDLEEADVQKKGQCAVAFSMYPTSMEELLGAADAGRLMPPKSTWFEPKLRSGLFIHEI